MLLEGCLIFASGLTAIDLIQNVHLRSNVKVSDKLPKKQRIDSDDIIFYEYKSEEKDSTIMLNTYKLTTDWISNIVGFMYIVENPIISAFILSGNTKNENRFFRTVYNTYLENLGIDYQQARFDKTDAIATTLSSTELKKVFKEHDVYEYPSSITDGYEYRCNRTIIPKDKTLYLSLRRKIDTNQTIKAKINQSKMRYTCIAVSQDLNYVRAKTYPIGRHFVILGSIACLYCVINDIKKMNRPPPSEPPSSREDKKGSLRSREYHPSGHVNMYDYHKFLN